MAQDKLNRDQQHEINANAGDRLLLLDSFGGKFDLILHSSTHDDILRIKKITLDQLAELYLEIADTLGKPPEPTLHHLQQIHKTVGKLIQASEPREINKFPADPIEF